MDINIKKRIFTSLILFSLLFLIISYKIIMISSLLVLGIISFLEYTDLTKKIYKKKIYIFISNLIFLSYLFFFCFIFFIFSNFIQFKIFLISILLGCIASDIGGFFFGKLFKGPKLSKISPNKTISGSLGSFIFCIFIVSFLINYFTGIFNFKILIVAFLTSLSCQLGDLFFSFLKRKAKKKDTGRILPGHGGILDRLDGIFLGIPLGLISLIFLF